METALPELSKAFRHVFKSTPWHISFASIYITAKYCLTIGFVTVESNVPIKENPKAPTRCDGSLSSFISTKMLVVVYM